MEHSGWSVVAYGNSSHLGDFNVAYYPDLWPCDYFGTNPGELLAIGWLSTTESYTRGDVKPKFFEALMRLLVNPWQPVALAGRSHCPFCRLTGGPAQIAYKGIAVSVGSTNLVRRRCMSLHHCLRTMLTRTSTAHLSNFRTRLLRVQR